MLPFVLAWSSHATLADAAQKVPAAVHEADQLVGDVPADRPGGIVLVSRDGKLLYQRAFGAADIEQGVAISPATKFHVASLSKQFTALAVVLLVREGRIDLDADIRRYLPDLPDFGKPIRVRMLLNHTSGLRDQWDLFGLSGTGIQSVLTQRAILALVKHQRTLNFVPGSEYRYSNTGYTLAAEIVARASGMSFRRFVADRIFTPLGMSDSQIYDDAASLVAGRAQSYAVLPTGQVELRRLNFSNYGATSMLTTAADLDRWAQELIAPRVFDPALIASLSAPTRLNDGTLSNYGFGLHGTHVRGVEAVMHSGSDAGFRAVFATYPADRTSIVVLSNASADVASLHERLLAIFGRGVAARPEKVALDPALLASLPGYYASGWGPGFQLKQVDGALMLERAGRDAPQPMTFSADGYLELGAAQARFRVQRASVNGDVEALEEVPSAGPPVRHRRVERVPVTTAALRQLTGEYRSSELDITYSLAWTGEQLELTSLQTPEPRVLTPVRPDWFDMATARVTVVRDRGGEVRAIQITTSRSRDVVFDRVKSTGDRERN